MVINDTYAKNSIQNQICLFCQSEFISLIRDSLLTICVSKRDSSHTLRMTGFRHPEKK